LIAFTTAVIAIIILSACVIVGLVICLCLKSTVSDSHLCLVDLMWHACVR
jgi:hypothetical protein